MDKKTFCAGRYEVFQEVKGKSNIIYFAFDNEDKRPVALKPMKNQSTSSWLKLQQETQLWVDINFTPYIVKLLAVEIINDTPTLVMEWINCRKGGKSDLKTWQERQSQYTLNVVLKFALQFCYALTRCIQKHPGFKHRDIKPENILIDCNENIKICDISISNGTDGYIAPEIKAGDKYSELTDIYSFGKTFISFFDDRLSGDPLLINETKSIIEKCCKEISAQRFNSFREIYSRLQTIFNKCNGAKFSPEADSQGTIEQAIQNSLALAQLGYHSQAVETLTVATSHIIISGFKVKTPYYSTNILYNIANAYYNLEQYNDALLYIDHALYITQEEYRFWDLKAHILYFNNNENYPLEVIMQCIQKSLRLCPKNITMYQLKSRILSDNEKFGDAINVLKKILEIEPKNKEAIRRMAINYKSMSIWDMAISYYKKLLLIAPDDRNTILKDIVACHLENDNIVEAQNVLAPLYQEPPNDYSISWLQANIWLRMGNRQDAYIELSKDKILLETEIAFNDGNHIALEILASVCSLLFEFKKSEIYIERAYSAKQNKQRMIKLTEINRLCKLESEVEDFFEACHSTIKDNATEVFDSMLATIKEYLRKFSKYDQDNLAVQYILMNLYFYATCIYFKRGQYPQALATIEKAQQIFPIQPFYLINKTKLLYLNGRFKDALACIKYGEKTYNGTSFYNDLRQIKEQILNDHPVLDD